MRYLIFVLLISLPYIGGAMGASSILQGETAIAQQAIPDEFAPKKQRFFEQIAVKILAKRMHKAVGGKYGEEGKWMAIIGLACGVLGATAFALVATLRLAGLIVGLVLGVAGLIISLIALDVATSHERRIRWIRNIAIAGIILSLLVVASGAGLTFLELAFGA